MFWDGKTGHVTCLISKLHYTSFKQTISPVLKMRTYSEEQQYDVGKKKRKKKKEWYRRLNKHLVPLLTLSKEIQKPQGN